MANKTTHLRASQLVFAYGPGAIIETKNGPRIILNYQDGYGRYFNNTNLENYKIEDIRMLNFLGKDSMIFSPITNQAERRKQSNSIYNTIEFPKWKLCYGNHENKKVVLHNMNSCPLCHDIKNQIAVRYVMACPDGHISDVDWNFAVHGEKRCNINYFYWDAKGSSLSDIKITCSKCKISKTMGVIYYMDFDCNGYYPEKQPHQQKTSCSNRMKVMMRQSSSLRIPIIKSLLTIPKYEGKLANILARSRVKATLSTIISFKETSNEDLDLLNLLEKHGHQLEEEEFETIKDYINEEGESSFIEFMAKIVEEKEYLDYVLEEYQTLKNSPKPGKNFVIGIPQTYELNLNYDKILMEVFPVEKLRVVSVQTGYQRFPFSKQGSQAHKVVSTATEDRTGTRWFMGIEGIGEGIFLTTKLNPLEKITNKDNIKRWLSIDYSSFENLYSDYGNEILFHPLFVWWHTLSHALIKEISLYSGYGHAALRERIYCNPKNNEGGILIYTSNTGQEGTMGGLVDLVEDFSKIFRQVVENIQICSNDPICLEQTVEENKTTGASCYSCLYSSETSCEHYNKWLDRHLLLGD